MDRLGVVRAAPVKVVVEHERFVRWASSIPGAVVPPGFETDPLGPPSRGLSAVGRVPAPVAAALAIHAAAEVSVVLRVWQPLGGVIVCAAVNDGLVGSLSRPSGSGSLDEPTVEVALLDLGDLVDELLRWVPAVPPPVEGLAAAGVHVAVSAADDAMPRWEETWLGGARTWRRLTPTGSPGAPWLEVSATTHAGLAGDLDRILADCLTGDDAERGGP